jgi:hypothetical protein
MLYIPRKEAKKLCKFHTRTYTHTYTYTHSFWYYVKVYMYIITSRWFDLLLLLLYIKYWRLVVKIKFEIWKGEGSWSLSPHRTLMWLFYCYKTPKKMLQMCEIFSCLQTTVRYPSSHSPPIFGTILKVYNYSYVLKMMILWWTLLLT